jgi:hypothetical protein
MDNIVAYSWQRNPSDVNMNNIVWDARYDVLINVMIQAFFHYRENGGSKLLRNVGTHIPIYNTSYSIKFKTSFVGLFKQLIMTVSIYNRTVIKGGSGSSVCIATDYGLDGPRVQSRWGRDFPPVQTDPGAHPASCTMGTGSFPGVNCDEAWCWPLAPF